MVSNRRIYYLSGFDPRGARFYHRLFRDEAHKSTLLSGATISTGKRVVLNKLVTQWQIKSLWDTRQVNTDYRFMVWDDIMKDYWISNIWKLILKSIPMYWAHFRCNLFAKFKKAGRGPFICSVYPLAYVFSVVSLSILLTLITYICADYLLSNLFVSTSLSLLTLTFFLKWSVSFGEKLGVWWVLQTYFFLSRWAKQPLEDLEARIQEFADQIISDQKKSPADEVLLIGHCVGTILTVGVVEKIINQNHEPLKTKLVAITLGQCIPYLSYVPTANHFRNVLQKVAHNTSVPWIDMGARADPLCFHQVNPANTFGNNETLTKPLRITVRPYQMFDEAKYKVIKKNKLRIHFQYLMASDIRTSYDYFEMVTSPEYNVFKK